MEIFMNNEDLIVSKTDLKGRITYGNEYFIKISGYEEKELLDSPHNILRHSDMPKIIFKFLWDKIQNKQHINAYVKNKTKNGDFYWVLANVTASLDNQDSIVGYYSVRRKPAIKAIKFIETLYQNLLEAEKKGGLKASARLLEKALKKEGVTYDELIVNLQK